MLPPDARSVLTDALRPPPGTELDQAVALTFSLDLESALVVPLAFAGRAFRETNDPLTVMESVRRCADKVDIFCQAGQISVPSAGNDLYAFLESMVHPVARPRPGRLFHPKLWALRYWDDVNEVYLARLLVLSRNLTSTRSWDTCLRLDGEVMTTPQASNKPIADLIRHAMGLAIDLPDLRRTALEGLVEDLRRVEWERPDGVDDFVFHALGVPSPSRPDFSGSRHLVVSPFCNAAGLAAATEGGDRTVFVGRQDELDRLPESVLDGKDVFVVNELAGLPADDAEPSRGILTGLHAKFYVTEDGKRARVFVGSANATDAAFGGNTEFLVELLGTRKSLGVETMTAPEAGFRQILEPYNRLPAVERDDKQWQLENYLRDVAARSWTATVRPVEDLYAVDVSTTTAIPSADDVEVLAELQTRRGEGVRLEPGAPVAAQFVKLPTTDITPFIALVVRDDGGRQASTVVHARLVGDPATRLDEILARQVDTPEKFLRFLALLLGLGGASVTMLGEQGAGGAGSWSNGTAPGVLELLMRGLVDHPRQLDDLARLLTRLNSTAQGEALLPEGFAALWAVIDEVRRELEPEATP